MKYNNYIATVLCLVIHASVISQEVKEATAQITFKVTDDIGKPVPEVEVMFGGVGIKGIDPGNPMPLPKKLTDARGEATITANSAYNSFTFDAHKKGYYDLYSDVSAYDYSLYDFTLDEEIVNGRWQPWNKVVEIKLYHILNPVPLCARNAGESKPLQLPAIDKPVGFDLEISDWVAPHGQGKVADLIFQLAGATQETQKPFHATMTVTFSNPMDGIIYVPKVNVQRSALQLPYLAPENGYIGNYVMTETLRTPRDRTDTVDLRVSSTHPGDSYFLRLRTKTDEEGKIISANYAKIYGDISNEGIIWSPKNKIIFKYYFNPKPNDRNLEYSGKNLLDFTKMPWVDNPKREGVGQP